MKFTPSNGTITVRVRILEAGRCRVEVHDTGKGIQKGNMGSLFGKYVQFNAAEMQKGGGSGLGLWCK